MPTPAHSGPDTSYSGRTQKGSSSSAAAAAAAAAFVHLPAVVDVLRHEPQQASATPVLDLHAVAATDSVPVLEVENAFEPGPETGPGAAAAAAVAVTAAGLEAAAGFEADLEFEFVPADGEPLPVEVVPGDSMPPDYPAPDMVESMPSEIAVVGPAVPVVMEAVLGFEAALPHERHFDLN